MADRTDTLLGGSFLMTQAGPERLNNAPRELVTIAPSELRAKTRQ